MKNFSKILLAQVAQVAQTFRNLHQYRLTDFYTSGTMVAQVAQTFRNLHQYRLTDFYTSGTMVAQVAQTFFENATNAILATLKVSLKALLLLRCATNATNANQ